MKYNIGDIVKCEIADNNQIKWLSTQKTTNPVQIRKFKIIGKTNDAYTLLVKSEYAWEIMDWHVQSHNILQKYTKLRGWSIREQFILGLAKCSQCQGSNV